MLPNISKKQAKLLFAAHAFVHTSRDGMVIANIINVGPGTLYKMSQSSNWKDALTYWGWDGDPTIQGDLFFEKTKTYRANQSLKKACVLWLEVFGINPLRETLGFFKVSNETELKEVIHE